MQIITQFRGASARVLEHGPRGWVSLASMTGEYLGLHQLNAETATEPPLPTRAAFDEATIIAAEKVLAALNAPHCDAKDFDRLMRATHLMVRHGCQFTDTDVGLLVGDDLAARQRRLQHLDGYHALMAVVFHLRGLTKAHRSKRGYLLNV